MPPEIRAGKDPAGMGRTVIKRGVVILGILALLWYAIVVIGGVSLVRLMTR
ncbi:MAG: hypothetical protein ACJ79K_17170 [Gemmatimonadaceae bacterium]